MSADELVKLLAELKAAYDGFTWESALWTQVSSRRSPYRTLVMFGLSARTKDALLVEMCREFFERFPTADELAQAVGSIADDARGMVRPGHAPFVESMSRALRQSVPRDRESLLQIWGVGEKISECVLAYGWGRDALPLDANCVRVLERVMGVERRKGRPQEPGPLRERLKSVYLKQSERFSELAIRMVDVHEILRLHGQVCCTRTPDCARCPVSQCLARRDPRDEEIQIGWPLTTWDDWRELINEPVSV